MLKDITHVGAIAPIKGSGSGTSFGLPDGSQSGDFVLLGVSADSSSNSITLPDGFSKMYNGEVINGEVGATKQAIAYRILDGTEPSSFDIAFGASESFAVSCNAWRGGEGLDVAFKSSVIGPGGDPQLPPCPSVTTVTDKCAIIHVVADSRGPSFSDMNATDYYQPPEGLDEVSDVNEYAGTGYAGHAVAWRTQAEAGETDEVQWDSIDNNDGGFACTIVLRPATVEEEEPEPEPEPEPDPEPDPDEDPLQGPKGDKGDPGPAPQMRTSNGVVQWKHEDKTDWENLHEVPTGGGGSGTVINVIGRSVSNRQMDIRPSGDPDTDRNRLQTFIDNCASDNVQGFIDEALWKINNTVFLHPNQRLVGRGMHQTTIDCPTDSWENDKFYAMRLTASRNGEIGQGCYLADFGLIGADKTRRDDGPLVRLDGLEDAVVERMRFEDPSSYGLFVSGYGIGEYRNGGEIDSAMWNSTFGVAVRDCLALRGQIGFGTEGGAQHVLFDHNRCIGDTDGSLGGLHGFRSASGYGVRYIGNEIRGYRNGFLLDRHREIECSGNNLKRVRNAFAVGGFYDRDGEISTSTRILGNHATCDLADGQGKTFLTDSYVGSRELNGLTIADNHIRGGDISLMSSQRVNIHSNTGLNGNEVIKVRSGVSGTVHDNLMDVEEGSSNVRYSNNGAI